MDILILIIMISMIPVLEARVAFIIAFASNLNNYVAFITIFVFSTLPSFILIYGLNTLENKLIKRSNYLENVYKRVLRNIRRKSREVTKFRIVYIGLAIFVAIPLPGTGVWTGSILSYMLGLDKKLSVLSIALGNLLSCIVLYVSTYVLGSVVARN